MHIRPAVPADIPALVLLERYAVTAAHWSAEQYQDVFSDTVIPRVALVIEHGSAVEGFLIARVV